MNEVEFISLCRDHGWGEPRSVTYEPDQRPEPHTHDFDAFVLMLSGSLTIASPDGDQTLASGDSCEVPAGRVHAENGGPDGGAALLATRASDTTAAQS